jgi:hypothetical protein
MKLEKCKTCGHELPRHNSMCPDNIVNSDAFQYRHSQMDELEDEFYNAIGGDINNITGYLFDQECGDR